MLPQPFSRAVCTIMKGLISVAFGIFIAYEIGFVNGLFTSHAIWVPR